MVRICVASIGFLLCWFTLTAQAAPIVLAATASGELVEKQQCASPGCFSLDYEYRNPLQTLSYVSTLVPGDGRVNTGLGYLVFDLSGISADIQSAFLRLDLEYIQPVDPQLTVAALPASIVQPLAGIAPGTTEVSFFDMTPEGMAAFAAAQILYESISTGSALSSAGVSGPLDGVIDISLNGDAISQINSTGGLWGIGLRWTPTPVGPFFNNSDIITLNAAPQLLLTQASPVPLPASYVLILTGLLLLRRHTT
ncbi:MAG: hypothetical protein KDI09_19100 [Halioglobus sp.]|nr:hypothetical protein [Halioglobus sp.]